VRALRRLLQKLTDGLQKPRGEKDAEKLLLRIGRLKEKSHPRKSTRAEPALMRIYQALGISAAPGGTKKLVV
jgi:hypothetical protein